jgi:Bromodomain
MMERLLSDLQTHPVAWAFLQPVNGEEVADYYDVIKEPMGKRFRLLVSAIYCFESSPLLFNQTSTRWNKS